MEISQLEMPEINAVVQSYIEGMTFCNEASLRAAFHPSAAVVGNYQGTLEWLPLDKFVAAVTSEAPAPFGAKTVWQIITGSQVGDAVVLEVADTWLGMRFTDFLSLLKIDDRWQIVHKLYYLHPEPGVT